MNPNSKQNSSKSAANKKARQAAPAWVSLNLLPDVKKQLLKARRQRALVVSTSMVLVVVSVIILVALFGTLEATKIKASNSRGRIDDYKSQLEQAKKSKELNKYLTIQNQLAQLDSIKDKKMVFSRLVNYLKAVNPSSPNNVELATVSLGGSDDTADSSTATAIDMSAGVTVSLEGSAKDLKAVNTYKDTLDNAILSYQDSKDSSDDESSGTSLTDKTKASRTKMFTSVNLESANDADDSNTSNSGTKASFKITVVFTPEAFSDKYSEGKVYVGKINTSDSKRNAPTFNKKDNTDSGSDSKSSSDSSSSSGELSSRDTDYSSTSSSGGDDRTDTTEGDDTSSEEGADNEQ